MKYGLVIEKVESDEIYVFGGSPLPQQCLQKDGQWDVYLPTYEPQFNQNFDTFGCQIFGTVNAVEILEKRVFGNSPNYSERYHYNLIPIRPPGGDPHAAAESIRKYGMIAQDRLPMTDTFEQYQLPTPVTTELITEGQRWLETRDFGHEWLWRGNPSKDEKIAILKEALQYSPVGISVTAWILGPDGLYIDQGRPNTHWCVLIGYRYRKDGAFIPRIFDTYDHEIKELDPNHHMEIAKRYHLSEKVYNGGKQNFFGLLKSLWDKIFIHELYQKPALAI